MNKEREFQKLCLNQLVVFIMVILFGFFLSHMTFRYFKHVLINNNNMIAGTIIEKYPELEPEIIDAILHGDLKDYQPLNKYDLDNMESIEKLNVIRDMKHKMWLLQLGYFIGGFILVSIPYIFYLFRMRKKIRVINQDLNRALQDDFVWRLEDYNEGVISNLNNDLHKVIRMLRNYSEALKSDKVELEKTLSDISHQMKTPLTSMYMINEILANDKLDNKRKLELLSKNRKQLERMEWLVSSLLKISRLDSGVITLTKNKIAASELIERAIAPLLIPIEIKNQTLELNIEKITFMCDIHWTVEALINIIKNAHEHTPEKGTIQIRVTENPIYTTIIISDNGVGICKKDLPHIFERFYKGNENSDSIGIGLNMAKMIIEKQNGTIMVHSKRNKGTTFQIKFFKHDI